MKPVPYVLFFVLVLTLSTAISFVGYRYLALANNYREANFEHLDAVYSAIDLIRQQPVPTEDDIASLVGFVEHANAQAIWCTDNLTSVDVAMFNLFGAGDAFGICRDAVETGVRTLEFLAAVLQSYKEETRSVTATFVLHSQITREIERLRDLSVSFQPYVTQIQAQLEVLVRSGTAAFSILLIILSATVARQLIRAQDRIRLQSVTDELTSLQNRRGLDLELSRRADTADVVLARIDLDRFKQVNDILGHDAGDFVLNHVAKLMGRYTREIDTLARVGGDEFVVLFSEDTTLPQARRVVERLLAAITEPVFFGEKRCDFGASFGIATSQLDGLFKDDLLSAADKALYEVKRSGRGAISVYSHDMHAAAVRERALADRLRNAINTCEIVPFFQTQHHAHDWTLSGIEVLARWQHPELGLLTPDVFLPLAAQLGLEAELDRAVFKQTVSVMAAFENKGLLVPRIAFNVSPGRLIDPRFLSDVRDSIPDRRSCYAFEILESVSYEEANDHLAFTIDTLKEMGFQVDVDDFGSGHASINSVLNISPNTLKIDKNIVRPITENPTAHRLTASIVELANALDMVVIAEGVDSPEKARMLGQMGCHGLQGFYFSRPMSAPDLEAFIATPKAYRSAG